MVEKEGATQVIDETWDSQEARILMKELQLAILFYQVSVKNLRGRSRELLSRGLGVRTRAITQPNHPSDCESQPLVFDFGADGRSNTPFGSLSNVYR